MSAGASRDEQRAAFRQGVREILPAAPAMAAWALVTGVAMAKSALTLGQATGLSVFAYAGAAQLAALPLLVAGAPIAVSFLTALMVNLRFVIYSAAVSPSFRSLPLLERLGLGYVISDVGFVFYMRHEPTWRHSPVRGAYFAGMGLAVFFVWHAASFVGLYGAALVPEEWGLDFAGMLALLALWVPMLLRRPSLAASVVAGGLAVMLRGLPARLGIVAAILAGISVAVLVDESRGRAS